jgi:hypothetical protein
VSGTDGGARLGFGRHESSIALALGSCSGVTPEHWASPGSVRLTPRAERSNLVSSELAARAVAQRGAFRTSVPTLARRPAQPWTAVWIAETLPSLKQKRIPSIAVPFLLGR